MKKKAFYKELLRTIKNTKVRFLSIFIIIALGVGFFAGINATETDMVISADNFYRENKLSDLTVMFPLELSKDDKTDILVINGVSYVEEKTIKDVLVDEDGNSGGVIRLYSLNETTFLDKPYIVEGREPENKGEILLDRSFLDNNKIEIGDTVRIDLEDKEELADTFYNNEYKVSGFAFSPKYVSFERGQTNIGSGSISYFGYIHEDAYKIDSNYLLVALDKQEGIGAYSDEYNNRLKFIEEEIEKMGLASMKSKLDIIKKEIEDQEQNLIDGKKKADKEFKDAEDKVAKAEKEIIKGQAEIATGKDEFNTKYNEGILELQKGRKEIREGRVEYDKNKILLDDAKVKLDEGDKDLVKAEEDLEKGKNQLDAAKDELNTARVQLDNAKKALDEFVRIKEEISKKQGENDTVLTNEVYRSLILDIIGPFSPELKDEIEKQVPVDSENMREDIEKTIDTYIADAEKELAKGQKEYNNGKKEYDKAKKDYDKGYQEFQDGKKELAKQRQVYNEGTLELRMAEFKLDEGEKALTKGEEELTAGKKEFNTRIGEEEEKIKEGQEELEESKALLEKEKKDAYKKIDEGQVDIDKAYKDIKDIPDNWFITSRENYPGYSSYGDDAERMGAVAKVFPLFFFLVAALVSLTTMTRMVEEERTQIGTFKALGYTTGQIAVKYIAYAFFASFFGSILGFSVGFKLFPKVIMMVYGAMYKIPNHAVPFHWNYAIVSTLIAVITTVSATVYAIASEMKAMPAILMQAKAPKPGKRIFLERMKFLWKRISFTNKVTARNVFRYKRRLFMTVLGIAGSAALLITGFGIRDSVNAIHKTQFEEIFIYDGLIFIDKDKDLGKIEEGILNLDEINNVEQIQSENITVFSDNGKQFKVDLMVPENHEHFGEFIDLHTRKGKKGLDIQDGIVITEKLSQLIGKGVGDKVTYEDKDGKEFSFKVSGVSENYLLHYIYMTKDDYKKITSENLEINSLMFNYKEENIPKDFNENQFKQDLLDIDGVFGSLTTDYLETQFNETLKSLDYVVLILIISAGALSFVVLYNLTNINITERIKEIATIKVLGFRDGEVSKYVYKENIILSVLGVFVGMLLGIVLHRFVMTTMEIDSMMFGKNIYPLSYLYSAILSMSFTVIVNLVMHFRLKKVDMIDALNK